MIDEIVGLPIPSEEDVDAILRAVEAKMAWEEIERRIIAAQPHPQPPADHFLILATGTAIKEPSQESYLKRFCAEHGNPVVADLIARNQIAQIKRLPKNMQVFVRSREAARKLSNQWVHFFGGQYKFPPWNPLADYFFIDIHGVENTTYMECLRSIFYQLGSRPIYDTYTHVTTSGIAAGTRRFYFAFKECPLPLRVDGLPIDQLIIHDRKFTVQCKGVRTFNTGRGTPEEDDLYKWYFVARNFKLEAYGSIAFSGDNAYISTNS
ncbi:hypothetical protein Poli38472_006753 [Pythium oligandrum]|uniref:Uncharacterized protein n=1 Tax=Pythium oligandrum TaxID=41045 RepID=A0A8K1FFF2_PYTOL|nr:hypothetical protein Poli38472_006753 [Pythium oligandrum]|eukprot:TMW56743.1 hypothetical protein Poli38472_006753 [Pythium oligandrum]